jgi:hypothetical protein
MEPLVSSILIGAGATAVMDAWGVARTRLLGGRPPDYALVGRWLAYMPRGRFRHRPISASPPLARERLVGWTAHYLIGVSFAAVMVALWGPEPAIVPALAVGLGSVAAPLLVMQPAMGTGFRWQSFVTHGVFGVGLYASAVALNLF